jgi:phytoene synthase
MTATVSHSPETATPQPAALPAAGSSFYTAMRILPKPRRDGMYAVYAFCRAVDDIADGDGPREVRLAALERWRADIDALFGSAPPASVAFLAEPTRRFGLQREDFHAVIDGMAMDVPADIRAPDRATLDLYCDRVASAVGRLSVRIFGMEPAVGNRLAHHLGRALQLTNILRDVDEDAALGRLYLPREGLEEAGIDPDAPPATILRQPGLQMVCADLAADAAEHFDQASRIMAECPRRTVRAPRLMEAAYRQILVKLIARGWKPPREPVKISKMRLLGAVLRHGIV